MISIKKENYNSLPLKVENEEVYDMQGCYIGLYTGDLKEGVINGKGVLVLDSGTSYAGEWDDGVFINGLFNTADEKLKAEGTFVESEPYNANGIKNGVKGKWVEGEFQEMPDKEEHDRQNDNENFIDEADENLQQETSDDVHRKIREQLEQLKTSSDIQQKEDKLKTDLQSIKDELGQEIKQQQQKINDANEQLSQVNDKFHRRLNLWLLVGGASLLLVFSIMVFVLFQYLSLPLKNTWFFFFFGWLIYMGYQGYSLLKLFQQKKAIKSAIKSLRLKKEKIVQQKIKDYNQLIRHYWEARKINLHIIPVLLRLYDQGVDFLSAHKDYIDSCGHLKNEIEKLVNNFTFSEGSLVDNNICRSFYKDKFGEKAIISELYDNHSLFEKFKENKNWNFLKLKYQNYIKDEVNENLLESGVMRIMDGTDPNFKPKGAMKTLIREMISRSSPFLQTKGSISGNKAEEKNILIGDVNDSVMHEVNKFLKIGDQQNKNNHHLMRLLCIKFNIPVFQLTFMDDILKEEVPALIEQGNLDEDEIYTDSKYKNVKIEDEIN